MENGKANDLVIKKKNMRKYKHENGNGYYLKFFPI